MSERKARMYVESVSSNTVQLENELNDPPGQAGLGITSITLTTSESTAESGFWGATGSCHRFEVIVRRAG